MAQGFTRGVPIDTDPNLSANSNLLVPSQYAVRQYVTTQLASKEPVILAGTLTQYWRGDKSWQTLNTAAVTESTNLYYTDARARLAISLTTTGTSGAATYNNVTGVLNIPQYTGGGGGGVSANDAIAYAIALG